MTWVGLDSLGWWLARKLLSLWVRATIIPDEPRTLGIDPETPIFYVIETRSLANLLVAEQACLKKGLPRPSASLTSGALRLRRSVAAVIGWEGIFRRRPSRRYSRTLIELANAALTQPELEVQIVPVAVFFGRSPEKEHRWYKLLLSDSWTHVGKLGKFFIVLLHGRNTWVQFSAPVALREFIAGAAAVPLPERTVRKLARLLRVHFRQVRSAAICPDLSQRHTLIEQLLQSPAVRGAIAQQVAQEKISAAKAQARARRYAYEIAADFSYPFILLMRRLLRRLWDRLYDGIAVRYIETLQRIAPGHTIVYLPCHRSHIDYLLLSYVLHAHGLAIPHIGAGINLNIPLIGPLLRRGGAFFLRRSFKGNRLYGTVFHAYLSAILAKGFSVEYFIEGGRSRTGFALPPKPGMLDMTVRSFLAQPRRPLVLVPVYIGYEKLVEGRSFLAELSGAAKQKESLRGFLRGLRALRSEFGKVHLTIGEPLLLPEWLERARPGWRHQHYELSASFQK